MTAALPPWTHIALAAAMLVACWLAGHVARRLIRRAAARFDHGPREVLRIGGQALEMTALVVGVVAALGVLGVQVGALLAGLGLTGFALGFALKDALSNLLAGVLTLVYQPFRVGDTIEVTGQRGVVESINLRYTTLAVEDGRLLVPNQVVFANTVRVLEPADADAAGNPGRQ